jgi:hypothetical protein
MILYLAMTMAVAVVARAASLPGPAIPDGLGVNIHFTDPRPGEMEMLADAGFKFVRMDSRHPDPRLLESKL